MKSNIVLLLLCLTTPLSAQEGKNPFSINADSVRSNSGKGVTTYEGNAHAEILNLVIEADTIEIIRDNGLPSRVEAVGNPLSFRQRSPSGSLNGTAKRIILSVPDLELTLTDYIVADPSGNTMKGRKASFVLSP